MTLTIPLISLKTSTPADLLAALSTTGFIHLSLDDSPLHPTAVARAFEVSSVLYAKLPPSERARFPRDADPDYNGLQGLGESVLGAEAGQKRADWKEGFGYGRYDRPKTRSSQQLPEGLEPSREELERFHRGCYALMLGLLDMLSEAFQLPRTFFRDRHQHRGASGLTLLNYPAPPDGVAIDGADVRAGAHKDWGSCTLLFQEPDGQPGLEIFLPADATGVRERGTSLGLMSDVDLSKGSWHPAPIVPGTALVNLGLMLESWTAGLCVATLHRVVFPPTPLKAPRRSIAFFGTPDPEVVLEPIGRGSSPKQQASAPTVREFFAERLRLSTAALGEAAAS